MAAKAVPSPLLQGWLDVISRWWLGALEGVTWSDAAIFTVRACPRSLGCHARTHVCAHPYLLITY